MFGFSPYASAPFGSTGGVAGEVTVTGVAATSALGNETVQAQASVTETGVSATGAVGNETVQAQVSVTVTGISRSCKIGTGESVQAQASVTETGVSATGAIGNEAISAEVSLTETGLSATGQIGAETVTADANHTETGLSATGALGSATVTADVNVSVTGVSARGNPELGGALHAEYFVPTDSHSPNIKIMAFEDNTTVSSDGSSLGTISSAGGTLTVSASNYENKLISADKPITLQSTANETTGVPTSWQGTSFGFRNTRTGVVLQFRSISGTATVQIFKDGSLETTLSVPDNTTTSQTYADDTSDPEYQIFSDLPIVGFKSGNATLQTDTHPLFPASRELYGFASGSANIVKVENYGSSSSYAEFESDGTTSSTTTISTVRGTGGSQGDFKGPSIRVVTAEDVAGFSVADGDGGEKTSFIAEGCFANEFRLIEDAEFLAIMGAPGTDSRNINVFDSSGNLIDTVQLSGDTSSSNFPTKVQIVSNSTTDSALTPIAKSYDLTAGVRIVSEVPVGVIVESDSLNNEENLFGLRFFGGLVNADAIVTATGVSATGAVNSPADFRVGISVTVTGVSRPCKIGFGESVTADANHTETGVSATGAVGNEAIDAEANLTETGVSATGQIGSESVTANADITETSVSATGVIGSTSVTADANHTETSVSATGAIGSESVTANASVTETGVSATGTIGNEAVSAEVIATETGLAGTGQIGDATNVVAKASLTPTGVSGTGETGTLTFKFSYDVTGVEGTGQTGDATGVNAQASVTETGVSATGTIGAETVQAQASVIETGVSATGTIGAESVNAQARVIETGVSATGVVGNEVVNAEALITETGLGATGEIGSETVQAQARVIETSVSATGVIGSESVTANAVVTETGVSATVAIGSETVDAQASAIVTGVSATASVNNIERIRTTGTAKPDGVEAVLTLATALVWGPIDDAQTVTWTNVTDAQTKNWVNVNDAQTVTWANVSDSQSTTWTTVNDGNTVTWVEVET